RGVLAVPIFSLFSFSSRRRHTSFSRDWSSDVCSSDLTAAVMPQRRLTGITGNKPGGTAATGLAADAVVPAPMGRVKHRGGGVGQPLRVVPDHFLGRQLPALHKGPGKSA